MHPLYNNSPLYNAIDIERRNMSYKKTGDHRDPFETDRARVIHSFSFRRLQSKTQIFGLNESAFLRTRLTHSLEVSNIGRAVTAMINRLIWPDYPTGTITPLYADLCGTIDTSVIEAACLAHDLGHPPFGHRGEEALNYSVWTRWPKNDNGFEGNGHTLRLLTNENLEAHGERGGLNLTRTTLLTIVKYPELYRELVNTKFYPEEPRCPPFRKWSPPKCIHNEEAEILDWLLVPFSSEDCVLFKSIDRYERNHAKTRAKTLEASLVELADDLAYGTHDVEDAFFSNLISPETIIAYMDASEFERRETYERFVSLITTMGKGEPGGDRRSAVFEKKGAASSLINSLLSSVILKSDDQFTHPRLRWNVALPHDAQLVLNALKQSVYECVIHGPAVQSLEYRGGLIVKNLFDAFHTSPELLPGKPGHLLAETTHEPERIRILTDYIAGMTDDYAERIYNRLFLPGSGSVCNRM